MAKKLFVGNLNYSTTEEQLQTLFAEVGTVVSVAVITDRATGQARGFAFVEMENEQSARDAIARLNGRELNQRNIVVKEAKPPEERSWGPGGGRSGGDRRPPRKGGGGNRRY